MPGVTEQFFAMVLDYYRAPCSQPTAVDAATPVPGEFSGFLDCLARPEERLAPVAHNLGCHTSELLAASYFYIHQLLFVGDSDHYRILGLSANADNDAIRRRYRLLISLFHPDRITAREHWEEQFVRRLNHAYGVLKHPEKRYAYDQELKPNSQGGRGAAKKNRYERPAGWKAPSRVVPRSVSPLELPYRFRLLQRYPKIVIWLVIILLLSMALLVFLNGSRSATLILTQPEPASTGVDKAAPDRTRKSNEDSRKQHAASDSLPYLGQGDTAIPAFAAIGRADWNSVIGKGKKLYSARFPHSLANTPEVH